MTADLLTRAEQASRNINNTPEVQGLLRDLAAALGAMERLRDLARHQRAALHEEGLISDDEFVTLLEDAGAVERLETYDEMRRQLGKFGRAMIELEQQLREQSEARERQTRIHVTDIRLRNESLAEVDRLQQSQVEAQERIAELTADKPGDCEEHVYGGHRPCPWCRLAQATQALEFYADPDSYFAIGFFPDSPCGEFIEDFEEIDGAARPGKRARETLAILNPTPKYAENARDDQQTADVEVSK